MQKTVEIDVVRVLSYLLLNDVQKAQVFTSTTVCQVYDKIHFVFDTIIRRVIVRFPMVFHVIMKL